MFSTASILTLNTDRRHLRYSSCLTLLSFQGFRPYSVTQHLHAMSWHWTLISCSLDFSVPAPFWVIVIYDQKPKFYSQTKFRSPFCPVLTVGLWVNYLSQVSSLAKRVILSGDNNNTHILGHWKNSLRSGTASSQSLFNQCGLKYS